MLLLVTIVVVVGFAFLASEYWNRLFGSDSLLGIQPFSRWLIAGLIVPSAVWIFLNCGLFSALPPLLPGIAMAKSRGANWMPLILRYPIPGLLAIASFWAAITFIHLMVVIGIAAKPRKEFWIVTGIVSLLISPFVWLTWAKGGLAWSGIAVLFWLVPVTHCTASMVSRKKPQPFYARAIARMKMGKYQEAESEVIQQLETSQEDFEGWMMLAELYATQFNDLPQADRVVYDVCSQPNVTSLQISLAFHRLADWHLKLGNDPVSARRALAEIPHRLPETHFARMAQVRAQQLPANAKEWLDQQKPKTFRLPTLSSGLDESPSRPGTQLSRTDAAALANECVERLKRDPNDAGSRERLAELLVEDLGKVDLGIEQLQLLLQMPDQPEKKRAEWLSRLAGWHFRHRKDPAATKEVLQRLIREHPQTAQGFAAQRWLNLLDMEARFEKKPATTVPLENG